MGFCYYCGFVDTIPAETIASVVPDAWAQFQAALTDVGLRFNGTANSVLCDLAREEWNSGEYYGDLEAYSDAVTTTVVPALRGLEGAFTATTGGIALLLGYADSDMYRGSDLFDEVFWHLDHHRQPTPAYEAFTKTHHHATTKVWITGG